MDPGTDSGKQVLQNNTCPTMAPVQLHIQDRYVIQFCGFFCFLSLFSFIFNMLELMLTHEI